MADIGDLNSTLQNVVKAIAQQSAYQSNATPAATASTSPISYPFNNIGTASVTTVIAANVKRYGLIFHNPGTANIYVYPNNMTSPPAFGSVGGSFIIYPGGTLSMPSPLFANVNGSWSAFSGTGSSQSFTVVEFAG